MESRQRKGKPTPVQSTRAVREETTTTTEEEEERGSAPAPAGPGAMVWLLLVLLAAGLGAQGWLLSRQGNAVRELGDSVQQLRSRLGGLQEQIVSAVSLGKRVTDLEVAQELSEQKLEEATRAAQQIVSLDPITKLSALQSEVRHSLGDIRKEFPSRMDLDQLRRKVELLDSFDLEAMGQNLGDMLQTSFMLKENISSITVSLFKAFSSLDQTAESLQRVQQKLDLLNEDIKEGMDSLVNRVSVLHAGVNRTFDLFEVMRSQLEETEVKLNNLKEMRESTQQVEGLRELIQQLQSEKSAVVEELSSVWRQVVDQHRELEGKAFDLESALGVLQARVAQVETGAVGQNVQLLEAVEQELQLLKQGLDSMESRMQQCFSGEVEAHCETDCSWPHIREVSFPHSLLKEPAITLGVSGLSTQGSVGISVQAVDATDSGFKIQIGNLGDHHLSSVRVTWMVCA